jgi:hypothetical protein
MPVGLFAQTSAMISPAPGTTLTSTTVVFTGGHKGAEDEHRLIVGTGVGFNDLYDSGSLGISNVATVIGLPTSGTIYVRYFSRIPSGWNFQDHTYQMNAAAAAFTFPAPMTSPAPGSVLTNSSVTFTGGHTAEDLGHRIFIGSSPGDSDIFHTGPIDSSHTYTIPAVLPTLGTIYVRYWSMNSGGWSFQDHTYTMNVAGGLSSPPPVISPKPGSILTSQTVTFAGGHANGDLAHSLAVGSTPGGADLFNSGLWPTGGHHSSTATGLPLSGTIYVRYSSLNSGGWNHQDHIYTMDVAGAGFPPPTKFPAPVILPKPGATLTTTSLTFVGGHSAEDLEHRLVVATGPAFGPATIFDSGSLGTGHEVLVTGLPQNGTVYVRYFSRNSKGWASQDQTYVMTGASNSFPPPIVYPPPGSTLTSTDVTFLIGHSSADTEHWLYVGSSFGGRDLYDSGTLGTSHVAPVTGLPTQGIVYVRVWHNVFFKTDYMYVMDVRPGLQPDRRP